MRISLKPLISLAWASLCACNQDGYEGGRSKVQLVAENPAEFNLQTLYADFPEDPEQDFQRVLEHYVDFCREPSGFSEGYAADIADYQRALARTQNRKDACLEELTQVNLRIPHTQVVLVDNRELLRNAHAKQLGSIGEARAWMQESHSLMRREHVLEHAKTESYFSQAGLMADGACAKTDSTVLSLSPKDYGRATIVPVGHHLGATQIGFDVKGTGQRGGPKFDENYRRGLVELNAALREFVAQKWVSASLAHAEHYDVARALADEVLGVFGQAFPVSGGSDYTREQLLSYLPRSMPSVAVMSLPFEFPGRGEQAALLVRQHHLRYRFFPYDLRYNRLRRVKDLLTRRLLSAYCIMPPGASPEFTLHGDWVDFEGYKVQPWSDRKATEHLTFDSCNLEMPYTEMMNRLRHKTDTAVDSPQRAASIEQQVRSAVTEGFGKLFAYWRDKGMPCVRRHDSELQPWECGYRATD